MSTAVQVREHPIVFSGESVRAILSGAKTQTRRVIGMKRVTQAGIRGIMAGTGPAFGQCPYGQPGDRLWVKEAIERGNVWRGEVPATDGVYYRADGQLAADAAWAWKRDTLPSTFCPRGLSRLTLGLTGVRVERVQDISEADALAEGVRQLSKDAGRTWKFGIGEPGDRGAWAWSRFLPTARLAFSSLWDELNEARGHGWDANPWVWVLTFCRESA